MEDQLNILSLREQVYTYLRKLMTLGDLVPGSTINIGEIAGHLGISKTPLRDAQLQRTSAIYRLFKEWERERS